MDNTTLADELDALGAKATKGPWEVFYYDAGDKTAWDNCPSIQAPESEDCAVIHWDGFKQEYWTSANGDQRQIDGNAALIVALRNNLPTILAALRTPAPAPVSGNVAVELGWDRGMLDAAAICGALAETDFDDDADGFEAATGCASAIIRDLQKRRSNRTALQAQPAPAQGDDAAVAVERERCAKIAAEYNNWVYVQMGANVGDWQPGSPYDHGQAAAAQAIAAAIRAGAKS